MALWESRGPALFSLGDRKGLWGGPAFSQLCSLSLSHSSNPRGQDNHSLRLWLAPFEPSRSKPSSRHTPAPQFHYCPVEYGVGVRGHVSATEDGGKYTGCPQEAAAAVTSERGPNGTRLCPASGLLCGLADLSPTSPLLG